jgi:hypothetical protein
MNSTPRSDDIPTPPPAPVMFQAPRPGPGRPPSSTSTSEPPQSTTPETSPSSPAESLTSQEPDWSTRSHLGDDEPRPASSTSGGSLGSEVGAEAQSGLRGGIAAGIVNATEAAHNILTDDVGRHLDQFRATETEIMEISDAGARIISRKLPPGVGNKDFEDILRVGMAVASYVGRQVRIMRQASAARRQLKAAAKPSAEQAV